MNSGKSYGCLERIDSEHVQFTVAGRVLQTWRLGPPIETMPELVQRCLVSLGGEGWRPISHQSGQAGTVILSRVPYTAGSKLSTYGTLRFIEPERLVLTVGGSTMRAWEMEVAEDLMSEAIDDLESDGWMVHRRYPTGTTVVRG